MNFLTYSVNTNDVQIKKLSDIWNGSVHQKDISDFLGV